MKDRVPLYPGRVKLNPVSGQANTYDMVRADEPTQEGTPLSKATFLKDATAALFGLDSTAVPDDAFALLSRFQNGLGNEYIFAKYTASSTYTENSSTGSLVSPNKTIYYSDNYLVHTDGKVTLDNPSSVVYTGVINDEINGLKGKFFMLDKTTSISVISFPLDSVLTVRTVNDLPYLAADKYIVRRYFSVTLSEFLGYFNGPNPDSYPSYVSDGCVYISLGQLGCKDKARIATGSYVGTGTYGRRNPNSLTFGFVPKLIFIFVSPSSAETGDNAIIPAISLTNSYLNGGYLYGALRNTSNCYASADTNNNHVTWYNSNSAMEQMNYSGWKYNYIVIG